MKSLRSLPFVLLLNSICLPLSYASAFQFYEIGAPINATAGVGQAALANDASISYFNPAGMALLNQTQFMLGSQIILPYTNFSPSPSNTITGDNGSNAGSLIPQASGFFVYSYSPKLKLGVSLTAPYGGSLSYNDHWVGRFDAQQMQFYTLNLNPSIAYVVNDWLALGAGFSVEYANLYQTVAIPIDPIIDGQATLKVDNTSPGFNVGALITPTPNTNVGVAYRSQIIHHLGGDISFFNLGLTPNASTKMVMPSNVIASIAQQLPYCFTLLGEVGWANWSSMRDTLVHVDGLSANTPQNWHDTYRLGLGGQYKVTPDIVFEAGTSYDSSPTSSSKRTANLPMDRQIRVGLGMEYNIYKAVQLGLSYEYLDLGNASIHENSSVGVLAGSYSRNYANVFQASVNVKC